MVRNSRQDAPPASLCVRTSSRAKSVVVLANRLRRALSEGILDDTASITALAPQAAAALFHDHRALGGLADGRRCDLQNSGTTHCVFDNRTIHACLALRPSLPKQSAGTPASRHHAPTSGGGLSGLYCLANSQLRAAHDFPANHATRASAASSRSEMHHL